MSRASDIDINYAVRPPAPGVSIPIQVDTLHVPRAREARLPEPVTWRDLNGRPPGGWRTEFGFSLFPPADGEHEAAAIVAARTRERRLEMALLAGTLGQP